MATKTASAAAKEAAPETEAPAAPRVPVWILSRSLDIRESESVNGRNVGYNHARDLCASTNKAMVESALRRQEGKE